MTNPTRPLGLALAATLLLAWPAAPAKAAPQAPALPVPAAPVPAAPTATRSPVTPTVHTIPAQASFSAQSVTAGSSSIVLASVAATSIDTFDLVGATWTSSTGTVTYQVKTLSNGTWTDWSDLDVEAAQDDGTAPKHATEPVYVGDSTAVQLRAVGAPGSSVTSLAAMTVSSPAVPADASLATMSAQSVSVPIAQPAIISRAAWGADESLRGTNGSECLTPRIDSTVKAAVIHHTAGTNSYTAAQSASIVRGIYAYHVLGNGWCDIGYNFLIDQYGQIFEGRYGGITLPVHGAHATSWNTDTVGISFMMNSDTMNPTDASMSSAERLLAWKLGNSYRTPTGWTTLVGAPEPVLFGHRDVMQTDCPGTYLYARLGELRTASEALITRSALYDMWQSIGGDSSPVGGVHELEHAYAGGNVVTFANGAGYQRPDGQTFWLGAQLNALYTAAGGPTGSYGWPTSSQVTDGTAGMSATFEHGSLPVLPSTTTYASSSTYVPVTPVRLLDTRPNNTVQPGQTITLQVAGTNGVPANASAVSLNVTVTDTHTGGYVTVWPTGASRPLASNLNFLAGQTVPNLVTVKVGSNNTVSIYNSSTGTVNFVVDLAGYYATGAPSAGGGLVSVTPTRVLDTRSGTGASGPIPAGGTLSLKVTGGVVPASAIAVVVNLTAADPTSAGWLAAYPAGVAAPLVSNVNFDAGNTTANLAIVKVGSSGSVTIRNGATTSTQVVADVMGYVTGTGTNGAYHAADQPTRLLDTRAGISRVGSVPANWTMTLQVTGRGGVPSSGVTAVVLNLTTTECASSGYVAAYPWGTTAPNTSNLNYVQGATIANQVVVAVGSNGSINLKNAGGGSAQLIVDIAGYVS